jgi:hypothetical protein
MFFILAVALPLAVGLAASVWIHALWALVVIVPFLLVGIHDVLQRRHSLLRIDATTIKRFGEIYEYLPEGLLLEQQGVPPSWAANWSRASADHF